MRDRFDLSVYAAGNMRDGLVIDKVPLTRSDRTKHNLRRATTARSMRRTLYCVGVDSKAERCSKTIGLRQHEQLGNHSQIGYLPNILDMLRCLASNADHGL